MATAFARPRLSPDDVAEYHREGYLIYRHPVFAPEKFAGLKNHFEKKLAELPPDIRPEAMDVPHFGDPELFQWLFDDDVLDLVEPILGPDIALFSSHFICKPQGDGRKVPWHEDSAYWRGWLDPIEVVTVWLAIDPSTTENGCMYIIPRTHNEGRMGYSDYEPVDDQKNVFNTEIVAAQRDDSKAVAIELEPNQASLHDGRLIHGSPANTSPIRRCGYTMRYISTKTRLLPQRRDSHLFYLARGRDLSNEPENYGDPHKANVELMRVRAAMNRKGH